MTTHLRVSTRKGLKCQLHFAQHEMQDIQTRQHTFEIDDSVLRPFLSGPYKWSTARFLSTSEQSNTQQCPAQLRDIHLSQASKLHHR